MKKTEDKKKLILKNVSVTKQEIEDAERHLSKVLQELGAAPRAEKSSVWRSLGNMLQMRRTS